MKINILTCFPEYFQGTFCSLLGRAIKKDILKISIIDIKKYGVGSYSRVDDRPTGGGSGLIMRADVIERAINDNFDFESFSKDKRKAFFITSPRGEKFNQKMASKVSKLDEIIILCNRYEGVDQRAIEYYKMRQICTGKYILMGGETAAMAIIESSCRLIKGVLGNPESIKNETFSGKYNNNIECDQYTLPRIWNNLEIPDILLSGNHEKIAEWRGERIAKKKRKKNVKK